MNPLKEESALDLAESIDSNLDTLDDLFVGITPPFLFISKVNESVYNIHIGAQDVFWENRVGAFTGELSPEQLKEAGAGFVIVGHSERRMYLDESDDILSRKLKSALKSDMKVVLCVGEPKEIREKGAEESSNYVKEQIKNDLESIGNEKEKGQIIIAYEPLWSISTFEGSSPANPKTAEEMISSIKSYLADEFSFTFPVLYGGSTDRDNIGSFIGQPSIDGALVGSSSLDSDEFLDMINKVSDL